MLVKVPQAIGVLIRLVVWLSISRRKISVAPLVSPVTRLDALEPKATYFPWSLTAILPSLAPVACVLLELRLIRWIVSLSRSYK